MEFTTACPRNCYSTCTIKVHVENGRLRRIEPHPANEATPEGACLKGLSYVERVHSPDRILHPLRKSQTSGEFERITWDQALDTIVAKLEEIRRGSGPQSVLYYSASGTKGLLNGVGLDFWRLYGGCTTTYGDLCWPAGLEATRLTLGENKHNAPWDIANARLIVLWGKNAAETNIHQMVFVERALEKGARLVVIDPRRTETAERAELLIQPRPGTDGALALAVASLLIREGRIDHDFVARHVHGYPQFAELAASYTAERASEICEVPVGAVYQLADVVGSVRPMTINAGFGMQRYTNSGQAMRAIIALLAVTGNIGRPGAGWLFANLQSHVFDRVKDPIAFYPPEVPDGVVRVSVSTSRLGRDVLATADPPLRMMWAERGNPVTQNPETHTVLRAVRSMEFRVVVDQFMTDTAREADIVLPAKSMFEQTDVIGAYWHPYIQLKQKSIEPPGEVKPETEIYWHLARRLNLPEREVAEKIPAPTDEAVEAYLGRKLRHFPELTLERLRKGPVIAPGHQEVAFSDYVFPTPSGKIELSSDEAVSRWGANALPDYFESEESIRRDPERSRRYPLYFMTPNTKNRIHSQFNNLDMIRELSPEPFVQIHPEDADSRDISDGDRVRIFNDRGEIHVVARLDWGIKRGCVAVTNGWWITQGGTVNFCSYGRETDMGHGAAFHENLVQVEKP
jgi:anaerobic selenocysteine-containing dehydrogenase